MDEQEPIALDDVMAEALARTARQVEALEQTLRSITVAAELTSTDDEHDPEGATIAYERAQVTALLRQARQDLDHLNATADRLARDGYVRCAECGEPIPVERVIALPTARRCVPCESAAPR